MIDLIWTLLGTFLALLTYKALKSHQQGLQYKKEGILYLGTAFWRNVKASLNGKTAIDLLLDTYSSIRENKSRRFGLFHEFSKKNWIITDLLLIKQIFLNDFEHFMERMKVPVTRSDPIVGKMIFASNAHDWKPLRQAMTRGFSSGRMRRMFNKFDHSGQLMIKYLKDEMNTNGNNCELEVSIHEPLSKYTMDLIASVAYGIDSLAFKSKGPSKFEEMGHNIQFKPNFITMMKMFILKISATLGDLLGITVFGKESINFFFTVVKDVIRERANENEKRYDFLELMMEQKKGDDMDEIDMDGDEDKDSLVISHWGKIKQLSGNESLQLTIDDIAAQSVIFILGGFDTVMVLNVLVAYHLSIYPDMQERLYQEIKHHLDENDGEMTYDVVNEMQYLNMFINETLRAFPPGALTLRICTKTFKIPDSNVTIMKGDNLTIPIMAIHKDAEHFQNPDTFDPERFSKENIHKIPPYAFMPFGHGPRNCIGFRLGLAETKAAIVHLVNNFIIKPPLDWDPNRKLALELTALGALMTSEDVRVILSPRD